MEGDHTDMQSLPEIFVALFPFFKLKGADKKMSE